MDHVSVVMSTILSHQSINGSTAGTFEINATDIDAKTRGKFAVVAEMVGGVGGEGWLGWCISILMGMVRNKMWPTVHVGTKLI